MQIIYVVYEVVEVDFVVAGMAEVDTVPVVAGIVAGYAVVAGIVEVDAIPVVACCVV